jgi:virulence factor Mce-like protein
MKRVLATLLVLGAAGTVAFLASGASNDDNSPRYWVELDNAFGLIPGADFKVAGVRAGKITDMKLDKRNHKALVQFKVKQQSSFTRLRTDAFCETRSQSLIGEYFVDCQPGHSRRFLKEGATIPVTQTASTIPTDLVNNVLRLPQRERLRIILNEFGTATAGRGADLNDAIRRGVPALRETDRLLAILAQENQVIANLTRDADTVITDLANNKANVSRFVVTARNTAAASASRKVALAESWHKLPRFLEELQPTMFELGRTADAQTPALRDLNASAGQLTRFFRDLGPFSNASRPSFRTLGEASVPGRQAAIAARPTVVRLTQFARNTPELGKNLAIVLSDLYDRNRAVEPDPRSPGGQGWNGFEDLLGYVFWQSQAINIFDRNGYILKVAFLDTECGPYQDADTLAAKEKEEPGFTKKCSAALGPNQPGENQPDPSDPVGKDASQASVRSTNQQQQQQKQDAGPLEAAQRAAGAPPSPGAPAPSQPQQQSQQQQKPSLPPIDLNKTLGNVLGTPTPDVNQTVGNTVGSVGQSVNPQTADDLLGYLLG